MKNTMMVWDPLVRLFHWSLVIAFTIAYLSEDEGLIHIYSGYSVLGLISFRVIWGFIGTRFARFSEFVTGTEPVINYLKGLASGSPKHYIGHNPAGGWMIIALLLSLFATTLSGLQLYAIEEGEGPFASLDLPAVTLISSAYADDDDEDEHEEKPGEEFWEEIHEAAANFTLFLVFLHIAGVVVTSRLHGENLVKAMINGKKSVP